MVPNTTLKHWGAIPSQFRPFLAQIPLAAYGPSDSEATPPCEEQSVLGILACNSVPWSIFRQHYDTVVLTVCFFLQWMKRHEEGLKERIFLPYLPLPSQLLSIARSSSRLSVLPPIAWLITTVPLTRATCFWCQLLAIYILLLLHLKDTFISCHWRREYFSL